MIKFNRFVSAVQMDVIGGNRKVPVYHRTSRRLNPAPVKERSIILSHREGAITLR